MSRYGSGKDTTSAYRQLDVRRWQRDGLLVPGRRFSWQWSRDGEVIAWIHYYAYYHCQDGCTRTKKDAIEEKFEEFVKQLQPDTGYMRLYREIVLDMWRKRQGDSRQIQNVLSQKIETLRDNKTKLEEAFVYQRAIDAATYQGMRAKLAEELTLAEMELRDAQADHIEIEAVLNFAEAVLLNASKLWKTAPTAQKQRLQQVLFPEGVTYSEGTYRTTATCLLFSGIQSQTVQKEGLVALPGIEPGFED
jgi:hypothetical protein